MMKRVLYGGGAAGALAAAYALGSITLGGAFAQTPPAQPTQTQQPTQQPSVAGSIAVPEQTDLAGVPEQTRQQESAALASQAKITADQANATALAQFPGGTITQTQLDTEQGYLGYNVYLTDTAGKVHLVRVDAGNGQVLQTQQAQQPGLPGSIAVPEQADQPGVPEQTKQQESAALASQAKITADQANTAALAQFPGGTITRTQLDTEHGYLVYSVYLTDTTGKVQDVRVDAGNGQILQTQTDGPEAAESTVPETSTESGAPEARGGD